MKGRLIGKKKIVQEKPRCVVCGEELEFKGFIGTAFVVDGLPYRERSECARLGKKFSCRNRERCFPGRPLGDRFIDYIWWNDEKLYGWNAGSWALVREGV